MGNTEKVEKLEKEKAEPKTIIQIKEVPVQVPKEKEEKDDKDNEDTKLNSIRGLNDIQLGVSVSNDDITNKIIKKINSIEVTINDMLIHVKEIAGMKKQINTQKNNISKNRDAITSLIEKTDMQQMKIDDHSRRLGELENKIKDLNIFEMLKSGVPEGSEVSVALKLIENMDQRFQQKFKTNDERLLKHDEDLIKAKNDVTNIKNAQENSTRQIKGLNDKTDDLQSQIDDLLKRLNDMNDYINNTLNDNIAKNLADYDSKLAALKEDLQKQIDELKAGAASTDEALAKANADNANNEHAAQNQKDIFKRVQDLEKALKLLPSQLGIEAIKNTLNEIKEELHNKANLSDYQELKQILADLQKQHSFLKDQVDTIMDDRTDHEEIQNLKRRIEQIGNRVIDIKADGQGQNDMSSSFPRGTMIDTSKFVEVGTFNDFRANILKEFTAVNGNLAALRKLIDDIYNELKTKTSFKDLKTLEDDLLMKLEELRLAISKKFADKIETQKSLKYLDTQIKHIIDVYIKRMEKGDNWLLAKKPLGGHLCASCENYIGDLKETTGYVPWNKYPMRDPNDKLYRIGNGFSKMLQMITVDGDNKFNTGDGFYGEISKTAGNRERDHSNPKEVLPKIKMKTQAPNETEFADEYEDNKEKEGEQPKITKVYKKAKN